MGQMAVSTGVRAQGVRGRFALLVISCVVVLLLLASLAGLIAVSRSRASGSEVRLGVGVEQSLLLETAYNDMETGQRGFIIGGADVFLEPFRTGGTNVDRLQRSLASNKAELGPETRRLLADVERLGATWRVRADAELATRRSSGRAAAELLVSTQVGKGEFDRLRAALGLLHESLARRQLQAFRLRERRASQLVLLILAMPLMVLACAGGAAIVFRNRVLRPMRAMDAAVRRATSDGLAVALPVSGLPAVAALGLSVETLRLNSSQRLAAAEQARVNAHSAKTLIEQHAIAALQLRRELASELGILPVGWSAAAEVLPAEGWATGDCFDVTLVSPHLLGVMVLDIAGHGAAQAVVALKCREILRAALRMGLEPGAALELLADQIGELSDSFLTAFVMLVDTDTGVYRYANAGHPPALVAARGGAVFELKPTGPLLGAFPARWTTNGAVLERGEQLAIYTDGLTEARSEPGEFYGSDRVAEVLSRHRQESAEWVLKACLDDLLRFRPARLADDVALVVLCRAEEFRSR